MNVLIQGIALTHDEAEKLDAYYAQIQTRHPQQWMFWQRKRDVLKPILAPETAYDAITQEAV